MSVINISRSDLSKFEPIKPGWYAATLTEGSSEGKPAKSGNSLNYRTVFKLEKTGQEVENQFNTNGAFKIVPFVCAIEGMTKDELFSEGDNVELDPERIFVQNVGKQLDIKIVNNPGERGDTLFNNIDDYAPLGTNSVEDEKRRAAEVAAARNWTISS